MHLIKKTVLTAICLLIVSAVRAQPAEIRELAAKYKDENGIVLNNTQDLTIRMHDGKLTAQNHVLREVLVLNNNMLSAYSTEAIYHSFLCRLEDFDAYTMVPDGDGYKKVKAKNVKVTNSPDDYVFYDDTRRTEITYPALTQYAIVHLEYTLSFDDIHFLPAFHFQDNVPVHNSSFTIQAPAGTELKYALRGINKDMIRFTDESSKNKTIYTWSGKDIPRLPSFPQAPKYKYFITELLPFVASYTMDDKRIPVLSNPADLYRYYQHFIKNLDRTGDDSIKGLAKRLTAGMSTDENRAAAIYQWVQQNIRYVAFEDSLGGYIPRDAAMVLHRRFGDCKDIANLLVNLYRSIGMDAHYTWIGTRSLPYSYEETPLPSTDNHMICALKTNKAWYFVDGTSNVLPFGTPPSMLQGKEALIEQGPDNFVIQKVPLIDASGSLVKEKTTITLSPEHISGKITVELKGYPAWDMAGTIQYYDEKDKEKIIKSLVSRGSNKFHQTSYDFNSDAAGTKDFHANATYELPDYARLVNKEWYVNMNLERTYEDAAIDIAKRNIPVENKYRSTIEQTVVMDVPQGYKVSYLPPDNKTSEPGLCAYDIHYEKTDKQVKMVTTIEMQTLYIEPAQFEKFNQVIRKLREQYRESVVLSPQMK